MFDSLKETYGKLPKIPTNVKIKLSEDHVYVPSTTLGHGHLFLARSLPTYTWEIVMRILSDVGVISEGYLGHTLRRGFAALRKPGIYKPLESEGGETNDLAPQPHPRYQVPEVLPEVSEEVRSAVTKLQMHWSNQREHPVFSKMVTRYAEALGSSSSAPPDPDVPEPPISLALWEDANIITSQWLDGRHSLLVDLDIPHSYDYNTGVLGLGLSLDHKQTRSLRVICDTIKVEYLDDHNE